MRPICASCYCSSLLPGTPCSGLTPATVTGCKAAVISPQGKTLATDALYITGSEKQKAQAEAGFLNLVNTYGVTLVAIGNGTASYETEEFTSQMIEKTPA